MVRMPQKTMIAGGRDRLEELTAERDALRDQIVRLSNDIQSATAERDTLIAAAYEDAAQLVYELTNIECDWLGVDGEVIVAAHNLNCGEHEAVRERTPAHARAALEKIRESERADEREKIREEAKGAWVYANRRREAVQWIAAIVLLGISAAIWLDLLGFAKW